jgi:signal transduction histidine kinase/CheY-like chemotaxis protein
MTHPWEILVVDDDLDVVRSTQLALESKSVLGRSVCITSASSSHEALEILSRQTKFALIILDVVMESPHAGLDLVKAIRGDLGMSMVRIVLRTGHPGSAPEREVIDKYEINDYLLKSQTDRTGLLTSVVTALRAYEQLWNYDRLQNSMSHILELSNSLMMLDEIQPFGEMCVKYVPIIFGEGVTCAIAFSGVTNRYGVVGLTIVAASEPLAYCVERFGELESQVKPSSIKSKIQEILDSKTSIATKFDRYEYLKILEDREIVFWIHSENEFDPLFDQTIRHFINSTIACATRIALMRDRVTKAVMMMGIFAHEFRTPLSSMQLANDFMLDQLESGSVVEGSFKTLLDSNTKILQGMNDHIDATMINARAVMKEGYSLYAINAIDVTVLITDMLKIHATNFARCGEVEFKKTEPCYAMADKIAIEQVFLNLMRNSLKALAARKVRLQGPQIVVDLSSTDGVVTLRFRDQGIGMELSTIDKIFDPFYSGSNSPSHGLGLTMVKRAITAMNGSIECVSTPEVGTTFTVQLPASPLQH